MRHAVNSQRHLHPKVSFWGGGERRGGVWEWSRSKTTRIVVTVDSSLRLYPSKDGAAVSERGITVTSLRSVKITRRVQFDVLEPIARQ